MVSTATPAERANCSIRYSMSGYSHNATGEPANPQGAHSHTSGPKRAFATHRFDTSGTNGAFASLGVYGVVGQVAVGADGRSASVRGTAVVAPDRRMVSCTVSPGPLAWIAPPSVWPLFSSIPSTFSIRSPDLSPAFAAGVPGSEEVTSTP